MKRIVVSIVIILLLMTAAAASSEEKVKIGYLRLTISLPTFVAAEKGLFEQEGVKVELTPFESGTLIISALIAGRIDANCSSATTGYWFAEQSTPDQFKIFLGYGTPSRKNPTFVAIVKKDSPLKDLKSKGKARWDVPWGFLSRIGSGNHPYADRPGGYRLSRSASNYHHFGFSSRTD
ncbi:MAG: ABC transporter substrate-binding protein [Thermodesulfobacteriota bacterium]